MKRHRIATILISALIGAFYWWVLIHVWGMHSVDSTWTKWLLANVSPRDHPTFFKAAIYSQDMLLNVLISVPFASMFVLFARLNNWLCIAAAVLALNVLHYWGTEFGGDTTLFKHWAFWIGLAISLLALPVAFAAVRAMPNHD